MAFPFVTRRSFDIIREQRDELKTEVSQLRADYAYLMNQFIWRGTKIPLDPEKLPTEYREAAAPKKEAVDPGAILNDAKKEVTSPRSARAMLKQVEEERERALLESQGKMHIVTPEHEVKEA